MLTIGMFCSPPRTFLSVALLSRNWFFRNWWISQWVTIHPDSCLCEIIRSRSHSHYSYDVHSTEKATLSDTNSSYFMFREQHDSISKYDLIDWIGDATPWSVQSAFSTTCRISYWSITYYSSTHASTRFRSIADTIVWLSSVWKTSLYGQ